MTRVENGRAAGVEPRASIGEALFCGSVPVAWLAEHSRPELPESELVSALTTRLEQYAAESISGPAIPAMERAAWIGDDLIRDLASRGLMGLGIPVEYGGAGLSMAGYCRIFEVFGRIDAGLALVLGIHQSIGTRGIVEYGTDEQKERFLPDFAAARRLSGFALTEPGAGSDAANLTTRAVRLRDGSWRLNGEKCFIGNAHKGSAFVVFARTEIGDRDRHVALIVEKGMDGFDVGPRSETMGLRVNDVGPLYFKDVRVPPENLLGEPGDGFRIAMRILENGRLTIAAGAIGCGRRLIDLALDHCATRRAFGGVLADLELVQEKLAWMMATRHALKAITSLTAALDDDPGFSCTLETAICKILGTDFLVGAANRALDLRGGAGYLVDEPYERLLRDVRVMPIFEGSNDVLRGWIPLLGIRAFLAHLQGSSHNGGAPPAEFERLHQHAQRFAERTQQLLVQHGEAIRDRQLELRRLCEALIELYAQAAIISRGSPSEGDLERASAELFLAGSDRRIDEALSSTASETDDRVRRLAGSALRERGDELMSR